MSFRNRALHLGYRFACFADDNALGARGRMIAGHEFHHAVVTETGSAAAPVTDGDARRSDRKAASGDRVSELPPRDRRRLTRRRSTACRRTSDDAPFLTGRTLDHGRRTLTLRLAIIGATGEVGRTVAAHVLRARLLHPADRLVLVGRDGPDRKRRLLGLLVDLQDAFDDLHVPIEVSTDPQTIEADIVVVAAGETVPADTAARSSSRLARRALAERNAPLFDAIGSTVAARLPDAVFIVVSNPVELAVERIARHTERHRVIGMGAQQDGLRFARAIATDLGISRHDVAALVLGEHGAAMLPLWNEVRLVAHAESDAALASRLDRLRNEAAGTPLTERVAALLDEVGALLRADEIERAFAATRAALPDARIFIEPFVTMFCLHSTALATANATITLLSATMGHRASRLAGQVVLAGDAYGIDGVCGVPVLLDRLGWRPDRSARLDEPEIAALRACAGSIKETLSGS